MTTYVVAPSIRRVGAGRATVWISNGWSLFMATPLVWVGIGLGCLLFMVLASIPGPGSMLATILYPLFAAGLLESARATRDGGVPGVTTLTAGLRQHTGGLLVGGLLLLAGQMVGLAVSGTIIFISGGISALAGLQNVLNNGFLNAADLLPLAKGLLFTALSMLSFMLLLTMAAWFMPALVLFDDMTPMRAMKLSFAACLRNWLPLTVYGVLAFMLMFVATMTVVGLLVVVPLLATSVYLSYREIFH